MVRGAVHNAFLNTLTMRTAFPRAGADTGGVTGVSSNPTPPWERKNITMYEEYQISGYTSSE